jgi:ubiquinone/menaquinone biosynthesis C-methylase UbiE
MFDSNLNTGILISWCLVVYPMPVIDPATIRDIVQSNFDQSAELYDQFEDRFGFFEWLTKELAASCGVVSGMKVIDIGCGTGTSSEVLGTLVGPNGKVLGLDFSEEMLNLAREKVGVGKNNNIDFRLCGANEIDTISDLDVRIVLYNACIFLIPEPEMVLQKAYDILPGSGTIGMNYLITLSDHPKTTTDPFTVPDLFHRLHSTGEVFAPYGRRINDISQLPTILDGIGFQSIRTGVVTRQLDLEEVRAFYSIPAQSAALWPKNKYPERLKLLDKLLKYFANQGVKDFYHHWGWCVGEK